jgi:hypothetical protein
MIKTRNLAKTERVILSYLLIHLTEFHVITKTEGNLPSMPSQLDMKETRDLAKIEGFFSLMSSYLDMIRTYNLAKTEGVVLPYLLFYLLEIFVLLDTGGVDVTIPNHTFH